MTKLERLLKKLDKANHSGSMKDFEQACHDLAIWTFTLYKDGRLNPNVTRNKTAN